MFFAIFNILAYILKGAGKPRTPMIIALVSLVLNFLLNIHLIPNYQLIEAVILTSITGLLAIFLTLCLIYREFRVLISIKAFLKVILASLITSIPTTFIIIPKILFPIKYMFSIVIYIILLYVPREITKRDIEKIRETLITFIPWLQKKDI